ncbi:hypothetical protein [Kyrpidia spormannii]|uniref:hypothetical protein n=1 Tax=Kyrpidia spormannii TaxID=2055160 RepID=UPI0010550EC6|nr:hypothetical protein [Kyrpidia spormannii]
MNNKLVIGSLFTTLIFTCVSPALASSSQESSVSFPTLQVTTTELHLDPKINREFEKFLSNKVSSTHSATYVPTLSDIQQFVDYAAKNGIIENTQVAKLNLTKELVRASMKTVVAAGRVAGYKLAAECLDHSLQDSPSEVIYSSGSWQSNLVKSSPVYQSMIGSVRNQLKNYPYSSYSTYGSMTLNNPKDLFLSLNKVNYSIGASKSNGTWTISVVVYDTYNFEYQNWMGAPGIYGNVVTILNNYGAYAQSIGAVVPYKIWIFMQESFRP